MERLGRPPAQGKGPGSGRAKKRSGAADLEIKQGSLIGGAKSCRVWRRSLNEGKPKPASLGDGGRATGIAMGRAGPRCLVSQTERPGVERLPICIGPDAQSERSETEHRSRSK